MSASDSARPPPPDGIRDEHVRPNWFFGRHANPLSIILLTALFIAGLSGLAGGGPRTEHVVRNAAGDFKVLAPTISRNGDIFEIRFRVEAHAAIGKLVIGIEPDLWSQITTNSTVPQAADESFEDGLIRFAFDRLDADEAFEFVVQQQINPDLVGVNSGRVVFLDDKRPLAQLPMRLTVLP